MGFMPLSKEEEARQKKNAQDRLRRLEKKYE